MIYAIITMLITMATAMAASAKVFIDTVAGWRYRPRLKIALYRWYGGLVFSFLTIMGTMAYADYQDDSYAMENATDLEIIEELEIVQEVIE